MLIQQHEIDAQIQSAIEAKMRSGSKETAVVHKLWFSQRRFTLGFNFKENAKIGDVYQNEDGSKCEVIALV